MEVDIDYIAIGKRIRSARLAKKMTQMVLRNYAYTGALVQGKTSRIRVGGSETRRKQERNAI